MSTATALARPAIAVYPAAPEEDVRRRALQLAAELGLPSGTHPEAGDDLWLAGTADRL